MVRYYYTFSGSGGALVAHGSFPIGSPSYEAEYRSRISAELGLPAINTVSGTYLVPNPETLSAEQLTRMLCGNLSAVSYDAAGEPVSFIITYAPTLPYKATYWLSLYPDATLYWYEFPGNSSLDGGITANGADKYYFSAKPGFGPITSMSAVSGYEIGLSLGSDTNGLYVTSNAKGTKKIRLYNSSISAWSEVTLTFRAPRLVDITDSSQAVSAINSIMAVLRGNNLAT